LRSVEGRDQGFDPRVAQGAEVDGDPKRIGLKISVERDGDLI
jgi:hypothetical protein